MFAQTLRVERRAIELAGRSKPDLDPTLSRGTRGNKRQGENWRSSEREENEDIEREREINLMRQEDGEESELRKGVFEGLELKIHASQFDREQFFVLPAEREREGL